MKRIRIVVASVGVAALAIVAAVRLSGSPAAAAPPPVAARAAASSPVSFAGTPGPGTKARCAVSGEEFTVDAKTAMVTYNGRVYPFCCADCKPTFEKNPAKYTK